MTLAYAEIPAAGAPSKPRSRRVTMMTDWGVPLGVQQDTLRLSGAYVDLAKIAVGLSRLMPRVYLEEKIAAYRAGQVEAFPGGMFLEYAFYHGKADTHLRATRDLGYKLIEVSDNTMHFPGETKYSLIRRAIEEYGLVVLGEAGSKHETTESARLVTEIQQCLRAGSWKVFVEAAEFFRDGEFRAGLADALAADLPLDRVIFELPGKWIRNIQLHQIHRLMVDLIDSFGPDVNIGNVALDDTLVLESLRQGIGVNVKFPSAEAAVEPHGA